MAPPPLEPPPLKEAPKFKALEKSLGPGEARIMARAATAGLTCVAALLIGAFAGWTLDKKLGSAPWLSLAGLLLGVAAGFKNLFDLSAALAAQENRRPAGRKKRFHPASHDESDAPRG